MQCLIVCLSIAAVFVSVDEVSAHEGADGTVIVHVTDEGFEPQSVEVRAGYAVIFENVGNDAHWPASDDHPTHQIYPEFDPKRPVKPNTEWSFTFDKLGEWEYHDHLNPYLRGEVVVLDGTEDGGDRSGSESEDGGLLSSIKTFFLHTYETAVSVLVGEKEFSASARGSRLEKKEVEAPTDGHPESVPETQFKEKESEFLNLVRDENPRVALDRMRKVIKTNDTLSRSCHALAHEIGRVAYEKYRDFGEAMKFRDEICNSGYLHGIIERRFSESEDVFADMKTMCAQYSSDRYLSWQCYHGIGHAVMFYTANDLPRSLEMCDGFKSYFSRSSCANGVFMENFNTEQKDHVSEYLKESDPLYPCAKQAERHKANCYLYAPTYFLSLNHDAFAAALEWCNGAEAGFASTCAHGVGSQAMKENLNDPKFVESMCMKGEPEQTEPCIQGMASLYINHYGSLDPARELCARLETSNQRACSGMVKARTRFLEVHVQHPSEAWSDTDEDHGLR